MPRLAICMLALCLTLVAGDERLPPRLIAIAPLGGAPGATFEAALHGRDLAGEVRLWSPSAGVEGVARPGESDKLISIQLSLAAGLAPGVHELYAITDLGLSNPLRLLVHSEPVVPEQAEIHETPDRAQKLASFPAAVHGAIAKVGEVDYYTVTVQAGDELLLRTFSSDALDPGLAIYKPGGSWFDPSRPTRLAFTDEPVEYPGEPIEAVLRHRFEQAGEYFVRVNGFWGYGGEEHIYALLIGRGEDSSGEWPPAPPAPLWTERSWKRLLDDQRMALLAARTVMSSEPEAITVIDADAEPRSVPVEPPVIEGPTLITGTIERPGDKDRVRFSAKEGDKLVFEIQTPEASLPQLNPLLRVFDSEGNEALTNIWSRVNVNGNISKQIYPKTAYAFPRAGDFTLEIRDITVSYGGGDMRYAVLVRPWVPHLGEAHVTPDRLNLVPGKTQKLSVNLDQEEGYDGLAVFSLEGLPPGVEAVLGAEVDPETPPPFSEGKKERFTTENQKATFALLTETAAPETPEPVTARLYMRPAVDGRLGEKILAKEILMMVLPSQGPEDAR